MYLCISLKSKYTRNMNIADTNLSPQLIVTVDNPQLLNKLKNAIKLLNGVGSISVMKPKKTGIELAHEDVKKGRVTNWDSVDDMFNSVLGK